MNILKLRKVNDYLESLNKTLFDMNNKELKELNTKLKEATRQLRIKIYFVARGLVAEYFFIYVCWGT